MSCLPKTLPTPRWAPKRHRCGWVRARHCSRGGCGVRCSVLLECVLYPTIIEGTWDRYLRVTKSFRLGLIDTRLYVANLAMKSIIDTTMVFQSIVTWLCCALRSISRNYRNRQVNGQRGQHDRRGITVWAGKGLRRNQVIGPFNCRRGLQLSVATTRRVVALLVTSRRRSSFEA